MEGKDSFILYTKYISTFKLLSNEQAGILIKHIFNYVNDLLPEDKEDELEGQILQIAWSNIKPDLKADLKRWQKKCETNKKNGSLGGAPKGNQNARKKQEKTTETTERLTKQPKTTETTRYDNDSEYDSEYDYDNDCDYSIDSPEIKKNQSKNPAYNLIFDTWNSEKPLIHHQELTPIREKAIDKALKNFQTNQIVDAIKHYAMVLRSQYKFTYKWDLETFLKQENAMPRFTDEGGIWNSFLEAVNENPLILALEDRTEDVPTETPGVLKNFMDKIK